jgi:hypothetical protein
VKHQQVNPRGKSHRYAVKRIRVGGGGSHYAQKQAGGNTTHSPIETALHQGPNAPCPQPPHRCAPPGPHRKHGGQHTCIQHRGGVLKQRQPGGQGSHAAHDRQPQTPEGHLPGRQHLQTNGSVDGRWLCRSITGVGLGRVGGSVRSHPQHAARHGHGRQHPRATVEHGVPSATSHTGVRGAEGLGGRYGEPTATRLLREGTARGGNTQWGARDWRRRLDAVPCDDPRAAEERCDSVYSHRSPGSGRVRLIHLTGWYRRQVAH